MKPNFLRFCLLLTIAATALWFIFQTKKAPKDKISGAYEALNWLSEARAYPEAMMPDDGIARAVEHIGRMKKYETNNRNTDPWQTLGPHNRAGRTLKLAFNPLNPNTMWAGSASGGLWRSFTGGHGSLAWQQVPTGYPTPAVSTIAFLPGDSMTMFIGTGEVYNHVTVGTGAAYRNTRGTYGIGILKSTDGGVTWTKSLDFSRAQNKGIWHIEVAASNPAIVFAATTDGVYKSTDTGASWTLVHAVVMANDVLVNTVDPNIVLVACGNQSSPGYGIYRSTNGGASWTKISSELPLVFNGKIEMDRSKSSPNVIFASIGNSLSSADGASWLCRSGDFGMTWDLRNVKDYSQHQGWFSHDVAIHPTNPNQLVVVGINAWVSVDGGVNLEQTSQSSNGGLGYTSPPIEGPDGGPEYVHSDIHDAIWHPTDPNVVYVASDGGVHVSNDAGATFKSASGRMQTAQFYNGFSISATDPTFCMGGLQDNGTIRLNPNVDPVTGSTVSWERLFGGDGGWTGINQQSDEISYLSWQNLNLLASYNQGGNYSYANPPVVPPVAFIGPFVLAPSDGLVIYAGSSVVSKSTDGGFSWWVTNEGLPLDGGPMLSMAVSHTNPEVVFAASAPYQGNTGHVFLSRNGGDTWQNITAGLPNRFYIDLETDPTNDSVVYVTLGGYGSGHVFRSTNSGATWMNISAGLPDVPTGAIVVDPLFPNNIYVGNDLGVFVSDDFGQSWESYMVGLPEAAMVFDLKISPSNRKLMVATHGNGVYQRDLIERPLMSSVQVATPVVGRVAVAPNPASGSAVLSFSLSKNEVVTVDVLGLQGAVVQSHALGQLSAGNHRRVLSVENLASGLYFVKIASKSGAVTVRLVVE